MPRPALVKFIGDENKYCLGHSGCEYHYCRDCETKSECDKPAILQFTKGKNYISSPARYTGGCLSAVERQHEPVFWQLKRVRVCAGTY